MAQDQLQAAIDGQEVGFPDWNALGTIAGLADDRLLSELLRMPTYDGTNAYKTILPYAQGTLPQGVSIVKPGTVQSSGSANGSIVVNPFRAVVGSRIAVGSSPSLNWFDIRSAPWTSNSGFASTIQINPNSSGQPRWDLIVATLAIDVPLGSQVRRVKDAGSGNISAGLETTRLGTTPGITNVIGTASSTPAIPATPSDGASLPGGGTIYYIPIAAVRVPNGFTSTSTVLPGDIRDLVPISPGQSPTMGTARMRPANGNNDQLGTYATDPAGPGFWNASTAGQRPGVFLPPSLVGKEEYIAVIDVVDASHQSHANGAVVDNSIDWRDRFVRVTSSASSSGGGQKFACDETGGAAPRTPFALQGQFTGAGSGLGITQGNDIQVGNSFAADATLVSGSSTLWSYTGSSTNGINTGAVVGLYVRQSDGALCWYNNNTASSTRWFIWIEATAQFPNY